jgi:hypothetical protein
MDDTLSRYPVVGRYLGHRNAVSERWSDMNGMFTDNKDKTR